MSFPLLPFLYSVLSLQPAAAVPPSVDDPAGTFELLLKILKDTTAGWQLAVAVLVGVFVIFLLRKGAGYLSKKFPVLRFLSFFTGDLGGYILATVGGALQVLVVAIAAGQPITGTVVWAGFKTAVLMIFAYIGGKKIKNAKAAAPATPAVP